MNSALGTWIWPTILKMWVKCSHRNAINLLTLDGDKLSAGNLRMLNPKLYRSCDDLLNMLLIEDTNMVPTL